MVILTRIIINNLALLSRRTIGHNLRHKLIRHASTEPKIIRDTSMRRLAYESMENPVNETHDELVDSILDYAEFDSLRFRAGDNQDLLHMQTTEWDPIVNWFEQRLNCTLPLDHGNIMAVQALPAEIREKIRSELLSLPRWPLVGLRFMSENLKSYILSTSLVSKYLTVDEAVNLSRLEISYQTQRWPSVESAHEVDKLLTLARVSAGTLFYHITLR